MASPVVLNGSVPSTAVPERKKQGLTSLYIGLLSIALILLIGSIICGFASNLCSNTTQKYNYHFVAITLAVLGLPVTVAAYLSLNIRFK